MNRTLAWFGLALVCGATAGIGQNSCLPDFGGARLSNFSFDEQGQERWRYADIPHTARRPEEFDWDKVVVEWTAPHRRTADCVDFGGRLLIGEPDGKSRPVDWFQGLEILVSAHPEATPDWSGTGPFPDTLSAKALVRPDGSFLVGVQGVDFEERCALPASFQVALRLGRTARPFVWWDLESPLLESSVAMLEYSALGPLTREVFERDWNARSDGTMVHRGPMPQPWTLLPRPTIALSGAPDRDLESPAAWIDELVEAATPGAGYSATMSGSQFLPVPTVRSMESFVFVDTHGLGIFPPLERLEAAGPDALPALLEHLDDARPTKLEITNFQSFGGMWSECRVSGNPLNALERRVLGYHVLEAFGWGRGDPFERLERYRLTVGDLCFVAIGQITNRDSYRAVQYQPSGNQVICSMASYPEVVSSLREIWGGGDARKKLFDWLMGDLFTRGTHTSKLQAGAATRLAYYFPRESEAILVDRLDNLDLKTDPDLDGINPIDLFEALSFSPSIPIQMALLRVLQRTKHSYLQAACFYGSEGDAPSDPVSTKLSEIGDLLPRDGLGVTGDGYRYLRTVLEAEAGQAEALFRQFLDVGTTERKRTTCVFFQHAPDPPEWARELLVPLLDDKTRTGTYYTQTRFELTPVGEIRICDEAALALAHCDAGVSFRLEGPHDDLDRQIGEIREQLRAK